MPTPHQAMALRKELKNPRHQMAWKLFLWMGNCRGEFRRLRWSLVAAEHDATNSGAKPFLLLIEAWFGLALGRPGETRTPDPLLRRQMLCPAELLAHKILLTLCRWQRLPHDSSLGNGARRQCLPLCFNESVSSPAGLTQFRFPNDVVPLEHRVCLAPGDCHGFC